MKALPFAPIAAAFVLGGMAPADAPPLEEGRQLFRETGCAQCHALVDAGSAASYAPSLDPAHHLTRELVLDRLTNGRGDMPSFTGILSDEQISTLADYIGRGGEPAGGSGADKAGATAS
ncbi:MAG TPA: cytochrome c [Sphingomonadaceae bacterium]|nr:cytochrome c [Sphingomonadaceae bacterium]